MRDVAGHVALSERQLARRFTERVGVRARLVYYPSVTREAFRTRGRITELLATGRALEHLDRPPLDPKLDRVMLCGNPEMLTETTALLDSRGFEDENSGEPGGYLVEKAFVLK